MAAFLGEIRIFAGARATTRWALCDGSLLSISQYTTVFSLLGTTYGGDGRTNFALPDLRGRAPLSQGKSSGTSSYALGQTGGL
jgi:microcystin-dependent protein